MDKYSDVTAADLMEFIGKTIGFNSPFEYDVFVHDDMTINVVHRITGVGDSLSCPRIFYSLKEM